MVNYEKFYESAKDFLILTNRASKEDFFPVEHSDIVEVEEFFGKKFPPSLYFFQKTFGKTLRKFPQEFPVNLKRIKQAFIESKTTLKELENSNYIVGTDDFKIVNGEVVLLEMINERYTEPEIANLRELFDVKDILFLDTDIHIDFIDTSKDDPLVHHFINSSINSFTTGLMPLSTYVRAILFSEIVIKLGWNKNLYIDKIGNPEKDPSKYYENYYRKMESIDISTLDWATVYDFIYREGGNYTPPLPVHVFREHRSKFYKLNAIEEQKNGYVLTVNEFEWKFIDFLKQQGYLLPNLNL
ncbi:MULTISPECIES: hypothetical protein [unclassified Arcicella]|uniref:hypothetical protein n=1 Tax=unclassified Arcicella TaxID=2644986 RepID=UPI00285B3B92|nr:MULTISPECIES: hypothetical protein [unclassified Arcicella]MDR6563636.1 hypothetical protein [Arcicella sp. BE51]MDR6814226.1 hypothetical protein [Arcicella sp. BE140]MDR6825535.1 hypothetical protein [Arcicella sp. BE139]